MRNRFIIAVGALLVLSVVTSLLAQALSHFQSGSNKYDAFQINHAEKTQHTPCTTFETAINFEGRDLDEYTIGNILNDYHAAWESLNLALETRNSKLSKYHFDARHQELVKSMVQLQDSAFSVEQVDLSHHLVWKFFSLDGTRIYFHDEGVRLKYRQMSKDGTIGYQYTDTFDYEVAMTFRDGHWSVNRFTSKPTTHAEPLQVKERLAVSVDADSIFGFNYYDKDYPWLDFWENLDSQSVQKDMDLMRSMHANTVRIFIPFEVFGAGHLDLALVERLHIFLKVARQNDIQVIITLFDFIPGFDLKYYPRMEKQMVDLVRACQNFDNILMWDLKNEPDIDYKHHPKEKVDDWLLYMMARFKSNFPEEALTIGWAYPKYASQFSDQLDAVSFHYYLSLSDLQETIDTLKNATEKPLIIQEIGESTHRFVPFLSNSEKEQLNYLTTALKTSNQAGVGFLIWTLHDFKDVPDFIAGGKPWQRLPQKEFGMIKTNGKPKKIATYLQNRNTERE